MDNANIVTAIIGSFMISIGIFAIVYAVQSFILMKLFNKAGIESWKAWVPFVNTWHMLTMVGFPGWFIFLAFVPLVNFAFIVIAIIALYRLPLCFEKTPLWGVLCIFFSFVIIIILAFDYSEYCGWEGRN